MQVTRDLLPALRTRGVKLYFVSIGTAQRGLQFCERTGLPPELLLCDPENATYSALEFRKGVRETFLSYEASWAVPGGEGGSAGPVESQARSGGGGGLRAQADAAGSRDAGQHGAY